MLRAVLLLLACCTMLSQNVVGLSLRGVRHSRSDVSNKSPVLLRRATAHNHDEDVVGKREPLPWQDCATTPAAFGVGGVAISPYPVFFNTEELLTISGYSDLVVVEGELTLTVSYEGKPIMDYNLDVCSFGNPCPVPSGSLSWLFELELTEGSPDGTYSIGINIVVNNNHQEYMCVQTDVVFQRSKSPQLSLANPFTPSSSVKHGSSSSPSSPSSSSSSPMGMLKNVRADKFSSPVPFQNCLVAGTAPLINVTYVTASPQPGILGIPVVVDMSGPMPGNFTLKEGTLHSVVLFGNEPVAINEMPVCAIFDCPIASNQPFQESIAMILPPTFLEGWYEFNLYVIANIGKNDENYFCIDFFMVYDAGN